MNIDVGGTKVAYKGKREQTEKNILKQLERIIEKEKPKSVTIGVPAPVHKEKVEKAKNLPGISGKPLKKILEKKFNIKVEVENDANLFALAEAKKRKKKNLVGMTLGTGLGVGIIIDGEIYKGALGRAGEISDVNNGLFETCCSKKFFIDIDRASKKEFEAFGKSVGQTIEIIANLIDPEIIVIGGGISHLYSKFKKGLRSELKKRNVKTPVKVS